MLLGFFIVAVFLSGCTGYQDPDFNKPLIVLPQDTDIQQNKESKPKPPEDKVWIEAKTNKLWVNSYVDENGDLVEGHYKDIVIEQGHWEVKSNAGNQ